MGRISMPQGKGSQLHNRRDYDKIKHDFPDNIDREKTKDNIVLVDLDIREAYKDIFGDALERYNEKQTRADRKIEDYYEKIAHSKNGEKLFYEDVLQWGRKEDFEQDPELKEAAKNALKQYAEEFQERNPNLRVIGAYIHMDEASPHLHLDYVPVAHGYSKGLDTRNSLDKALKEQGIKVGDRKRTVKDKETGEDQEVKLKESRCNNATMAWKERERTYFGDICKTYGLEVEQERNLGRKQLTVEEYKEAEKRLVEPLQEKAEELLKDAESEAERIKDEASAQAETEAQRIRDEASAQVEQIGREAEFAKAKLEKLVAERVEESRHLSMMTHASMQLSDENRKDPVTISTIHGDMTLMPVPELRRQSVELQAQNSTLGAEKERLEASTALIRHENAELEQKQEELELELGKKQTFLSKLTEKVGNLFESITQDKKEFLQNYQAEDIAPSIFNGRKKPSVMIDKEGFNRLWEAFDIVLRIGRETIEQILHAQNEAERITEQAQQQANEIIARAKAEALDYQAAPIENIALKKQIESLEHDLAIQAERHPEEFREGKMLDLEGPIKEIDY